MLEELIKSFLERLKSVAPLFCDHLPLFDVSCKKSGTKKQKKLFSTPFTSSHNTTSIYIKPRFIAYYEVQVTKREKKIDPLSQFKFPMDGLETEEGDPTKECVAVGLATRDFELKRLPGWDNASYGYHGDDGAIFHGKGRQLATYGPSFGAGDTVGCGVDYESRSIFFTLNGKYPCFETINIVYQYVTMETIVCKHFLYFYLLCGL
jgi:hypothetical protein